MAEAETLEQTARRLRAQELNDTLSPFRMNQEDSKIKYSKETPQNTLDVTALKASLVSAGLAAGSQEHNIALGMGVAQMSRRPQQTTLKAEFKKSPLDGKDLNSFGVDITKNTAAEIIGSEAPQGGAEAREFYKFKNNKAFTKYEIEATKERLLNFAFRKLSIPPAGELDATARHTKLNAIITALGETSPAQFYAEYQTHLMKKMKTENAQKVQVDHYHELDILPPPPGGGTEICSSEKKTQLLII